VWQNSLRGGLKKTRAGHTQINFLEEFQKMIDEYNAGASNLETPFDRLMAFTKRLSDEEKRGIAEQLTEEEFVIFDLLTKPDMKLSKAEEIDVKKVAKELLETLKKEKTGSSPRRLSHIVRLGANQY
jgi:type I restriction enzyme R subunit